MADLSREEIESIADAIEKWGGDDFIDINGVTDRASQFAMIALRQLLSELASASQFQNTGGSDE
jgi:hypothetical protein